MKKEILNAVWTLIGATVGAGILGLPYVFYKAGFITGLIVMTVSLLIMSIVTLYLGEIILRTKAKHQLTGLSEKYLGKTGKTIMFTANILSIYGALTAYILGSGKALAAIFGGNTTLYSVIFFTILSFVIYFSINIISDFESLFSPIKIIIALLISIFLFKFINFNNLTAFSFSNLLIPYGISIFALTGISAIPDMNEELKNKRNLFISIIIGMLITFIIYLLFAFSIVGSISPVDELATVSLLNFGSTVNIFGNLFALFAMATAFVALGFALKENMTLDYKLNNFKSWLVVISVPIFLALFKFFSFVKLLELSGSIAIGIMLLMILLIHSKSKKTGDRSPEYNLSDNKLLKILLAVIIIIGIIYSTLG